MHHLLIDCSFWSNSLVRRGHLKPNGRPIRRSASENGNVNANVSESESESVSVSATASVKEIVIANGIGITENGNVTRIHPALARISGTV